ncbi:LCP family protein [Corynebacterium sp. TAE3-ERU30]|uniref:LCP family protein n=1 Tax=Corynebacterium sp. TAE3-ERU30 TaxID=2849496 RepID=UPI001C457602|nr:LCP family protein [Corynebacterium sp. TAE3-ERU30]MBV7282778.1 LCP family protein [Corynebacterium sp. TAE3-ERU30]
MVAVLSVMVLTISGLGYFSVGRIGSDVASAGNLSLGLGSNAPSDGATDILLVGSDSRTDAQGNSLSPEEIEMLHAGDEQNDNTDTIMVVRVPSDGSSATAISIPRDTYIHDDEFGNLKINGVFAAHKAKEVTRLNNEGMTDQQQIARQSKDAGRKGLIDAIADLTGITVDHYAEVGLLGFVLLTDAVGGVEVCLNEATYDKFSGADFPAGRQTLSGKEALAFVRQRHGLPRGDLDRIVRQQAYMASLVQTALKTNTLTSPSKLNQMGDAVTRSVIIDEDWDIMSFATQLQDLAGGNVLFETIPVTSIDGVGDYGESVVTVDRNEVHEYFDRLLNRDEQDGKESTDGPKDREDSEGAAADNAGPSAITDVTVLNSTTTTGLAAQVGGALKNDGYTLGEIGNAPAGLYTYSQVVAADPQNPAALALADKLGGVPVTSSPTLNPGSVVVVVHNDYIGPKDENAPVESESTEVIGEPGTELEDSQLSPTLDAGGDGPRCVN